jgi:hypothetical protein
MVRNCFLEPKSVVVQVSNTISGSDLSNFIVLNEPPETFPALQIDVFYDFEDENSYEAKIAPKAGSADVIMWSRGSSEEFLQRARGHISCNSFSVPDYDSEDYDSEAEQPGREATYKVEVVIPPRDAAVPESDVSNSGSIISDDEDTPDVSEPWNRTYCSTFESSEAPNDPLSADIKTDLKKSQDAPEKESASQSTATAKLTTTPHRMELQSSMTVQATQAPTTKASDHHYNVTDEDESDYGDDMSADLFDDDLDFADHQKPERQPDNSSFSSQSPILTSLPSKIELAAAHEPAKPASVPVVAGKTQSDHGSKPDAPRAPSPSDAAMPKAKTTTSYPSPPHKYTPAVYSTEPATDPFLNYISPDVSSRTLDWSSYAPDLRYLDPNRQSYSSAATYWPTSQPSYYYSYPEGAGNHTWCYSSPAFKPVESASKPLEPIPAPAPAPASSFVTLKATPRVSIKDLVDESQPVREHIKNVGSNNVASQSTSGCRLPELRTSKRKADQISDVETPASIPVLLPVAEISVAASLTEEQDAQVVDAVVSTTDSHSQTDSLQSIGKGEESRVKTVWPEAQRRALAEGVLKSLESNPQNEALVISSTDVLEILADSPAYPDLCKRLETRGFKFERRGLAKSLMDIVPSLQASKSASASSPLVGEAPNTVGEEERPRKKARSNFYKYVATAAGGIAVGAVGAVAALVALPPDFFV